MQQSCSPAGFLVFPRNLLPGAEHASLHLNFKCLHLWFVPRPIGGVGVSQRCQFHSCCWHCECLQFRTAAVALNCWRVRAIFLFLSSFVSRFMFSFLKRRCRRCLLYFFFFVDVNTFSHYFQMPNNMYAHFVILLR